MAQHDLWVYLKDSSDIITGWKSSKEELAEQIAHEAIRILIPAFDLSEVVEIVKQALKSIRIDLTEQIEENLFSQIVTLVAHRINRNNTH